jgi:hypothetical protein
MNNTEYTSFEIYPEVRVYQNLLSDSDKLYNIMKRSEKESDGKYFLRKWDKWSVFGTYTQIKQDNPYEEREEGTIHDEEKYLAQRIDEAYSLAIEDYKKRYEVKLPDGAVLMTSSYSKYDPGFNPTNDGLTMQYHTDFIISEKDMPGPKFFLTCTMYINDDYEGGDIEFYIDDKFYPYKPKAGDILIFPSTPPYFHGVRTIKNGEKFFVRNFIQYYYDGSEEWLKNQKYHGAHRWSKMEIDRVEKENPNNMKYAPRKQLDHM